MARIEVEGIDELVAALEKAGKADDIVPQMLVEGGSTLQKNIREEITAAANRGYATGELAKSVIPTPPEKNGFGHYVFVRPVGTDSKGVRNGVKWGYLENGNGGSQKPHPFEDKATKKSETECAERMQQVYDRYGNL